MSIEVACSCGRTYSKAASKAGTTFRCHWCGTEVLVPEDLPTAAPPETFALAEDAAGYAPALPELTRADAPRPRRRRSFTPLVLQRGYPFLWIGAAFMAFIGANFVFVGFFAPAGPAPGGRPQPVPLLSVGLAIGSVFASTAAFLGWLAHRWKERFIADEHGITWQRGGQLRADMAWQDMRHIQLQDAWGQMVITGPPDEPTLEINNGLKQFDQLLERIQMMVDWECLVRARPATLSEDAPAAITPGAVELELPLVRSRLALVLVGLLGTVLLVAFSAYLWMEPTDMPQAGNAPDNRKQNRDAARLNVLKFGTPLMAVLACVAIFRCWRQFRIDEEGIEFRYLAHTRRYDWNDLRRVQMRIRVVTTNSVKQYGHVVAIKPRDEAEFTLAHRDAFLLHDVMIAAAARAGVKLRRD